MNGDLTTRSTMLVCVCWILAALAGGAQAADGYLSPVAIVADSGGDTLYVAQHTASQIAVVDTGKPSVKRTWPLPAMPTGLVLSPDDSTLYVTMGGVKGAVGVIDVRSGKVAKTIPAGHTPMAPVITADGKTLYVCNRFNNAVAVYDLASGGETARIEMVREPVAAALSPDGKRLLVVNHLPAGRADEVYLAAVVCIVDTVSNAVTATIQLPNGSSGMRGIALSPDGAFAYVTHILGRYHLPTTQLERGWMNTNALTIIDVAGEAFVNTVLLDDVDRGAANPWAVACTEDGKYVCVTHAGTHEISVIDRALLHEKLDKVAAGENVSEVSKTPEDVPNDLAFLVGMRRRIALDGNGPRALALTGNTAWAAEYFTDSLCSVAISSDVRPAPADLALGPKRKLTAERLGEQLFNDASLCFQQWQSCASCHPDVRADGFNWDLLNDGMGNPKNVKSLLLAHQTPPVMATGVRDKAETAVRAGIRHIQFAVRPEEDAQAIDAFLKSLKPVPSPELEDGKLSAAAERGKALFEKAGCSSCHSGSLYTDLAQYNIGTGVGREKDTKFDTPTLCETWRTGPYLHDGRAATIEELLTTYNVGDEHGMTSTMSPEAISDLAAFVRSL
ncbi:MAG: beta-propeller fold lactonase family protein [Nitrospiraceae bacterium]|nr:beta-propeller fold lactonase family protein [Nitrospiraceae bacterium]